MVIYAVYIFIVGTIMGSFFNVVAHRLSNNKSIVRPRSHCEVCNHELAWYELIPLLSFIFQGGKCRKCHTKISWWYPAVELITGLFYLFSFLYFGFTYDFLICLVIASLVVIISISDFNYLIILDEPLIVGSLLVLFLNYLKNGFVGFGTSLLSGILLFLFFLFIKLIGDAVFKRESLGGGDIKLCFFIGAVLGYRLSFISIVIGSFLALPVALFYLIKEKEREIPFGPFLIIATWIVFLFSSYITEFIELLFKL